MATWATAAVRRTGCALLLCCVMAARAAEPPATQPGGRTHLVKKGTLNLEITAQGLLQAEKPFEVQIKPKAYTGPFTVIRAAPAWQLVQQGQPLLECDASGIRWALREAENALLAAKANLAKAEADQELGAKADALALRMQQDSVKNAEEARKWFESVDGPQMLLGADLQVQYARDGVGDQEDELDQLRKMYRSEELTNATADIVIKRAVRSLERSKTQLKMAQERRDKTREFEYVTAKQKVADGLEQAKQALASLKVSQTHAALLRKNAVSAARIALEQAEKKLADLQSDLGLFRVEAPHEGVVVYGQVIDGAWQGGNPKALEPGEKLTPGQTVLHLYVPGKLAIEIGLTDVQASWLDEPVRAKVKPVAFPWLTIQGTCGKPVAAPSGNPPVLGYRLPVTLENPDARLLPGMKATVHIPAAKLENVLLIPVEAVTDGQVTVKGRDGRLENRQVRLGRTDGSQIHVLQGLEEGEELLLPVTR